MIDMKCIKCNSDLEQIGDFYTCTNPHCTLCGDKDMWQELIKLVEESDSTRKALDKAKWWLNEIVENHRCTPISTAEMALKEIIEMEQKDE